MMHGPGDDIVFGAGRMDAAAARNGFERRYGPT